MIKEIVFFKEVGNKAVYPLIYDEMSETFSCAVDLRFDDEELVPDDILKALLKTKGLKLFVDTDTNELTVKLYNPEPTEEV